jgi:hypothetical protein
VRNFRDHIPYGRVNSKLWMVAIHENFAVLVHEQIISATKNTRRGISNADTTPPSFVSRTHNRVPRVIRCHHSCSSDNMWSQFIQVLMLAFPMYSHRCFPESSSGEGFPTTTLRKIALSPLILLSWARERSSENNLGIQSLPSVTG